MWRAILARKGDEIAFTAPRLGVRAYLAVAGGIDVALSRQPGDERARGGRRHRRAWVEAGDQIRVGAPAQPASALVGRSWPEEARPAQGDPWTVRVVLGPQDELLHRRA